MVGLNWFKSGHRERPVYWHNGGTAGFHAYVGFEPTELVGVAVLTNSASVPDALGLELLGKASARSAPAVAPK